ncbi:MULTISPECIES: lysine biosynthesis protein LysW [unclassified Streptomyces]|uniref:lysine biosynthesis protein LysW n=1 Tax=unclassified Streptomyces TaxID=2593676 RepID=UPI002286945D|nr:lysine biosynthesis protein LysW [Streptomyces sp. Je 1-369]WAL93164.1 lysine biosynthesis protein LysW [Streptomyces sp. Je 1-369]
MTRDTLAGTCPECETDLTVPALVEGETLACPECMLTLRVEGISEGRMILHMVETRLRDWGQ